ncbi:hypothetical protein PHYBLDRAFT_143860 [Phycomyces blakesleeanus NRRL 1555(-)]|uniref:Sugar phosphate transporter domain-containing protein n=1 Tax=Phycomyces blakesleeanus (strain ATCC 8743b / DSM 1359 / FGSC 10004 / NBRC 33097 / NRRL 1555) TaxID=763407 RepID=A0A167NBP5_PHYB8|nr:hypothetical protein PHYBLDRAFT_143860 [Phycomyces blakesleeanus NRRL 1555(-)]OAD75618.1 hypothetical protein PHYBLDRAFT_143860 [Phycomyces blakesleeanus NRRL 1555(-)]|eukprot:XP_018293658.1 hypothetical protein PHYBLDRAFT_143860 [Phycomyces blakesleeanus NRRL 1555(-)]
MTLPPPTNTDSTSKINTDRRHKRTQSIQVHSKPKSHIRHGSLPHFPLPHQSTQVSIEILNKADITQHARPKETYGLVGAWCVCVVGVVLYNKQLMGKDQYNFNFPLLVSAVQAAITTLISWAWISLGSDPNLSTSINSNRRSKMIPCGVAAALEIGCSNASLVLVSLSFYTLVKASTPAWTLLFGYIFGFDRPLFSSPSGWKTMVVILVLGTSGVLAVAGEANFDVVGYLLVMVSCIVKALPIDHLLSLEVGPSEHPLVQMCCLGPVMTGLLFVLSVVFENPYVHFQHSYHFDSIVHVLESFGLMTIGGVLVFGSAYCELSLNRRPQTMMLGVVNVARQWVLIVLSVLLYGDTITLRTMAR